MKKLFLVSMLVMFSIVVMATGTENSNYVIANGQTHFGKDIRFGLKYTRVIKTNGEVIKIRNSEVDVVSDNGKLFEKLPVVLDDQAKPEMAMMEFVTSRSGLNLYRYCKYAERCDHSTGTYQTAQPSFCYFVFKDGKFYLKIDEKNAASALPFFGVDLG